MDRAETTLRGNRLLTRFADIEAVIEEQESWFFTLEASMGELRAQLRRFESSLVETIGQRLSSLERTMDERTQRLLSLESTLREWSSRLRSLESMAEDQGTAVHDIRKAVEHESEARIQHGDGVDKVLEDVRKTGERMLYSIAMLGRGLEEIHEQLLEKRLLLLEANPRLVKST